MWIPELTCCLQWLLDVFLKYLDNWEKSVEKREGFAKEEKNLMMLSHETSLGLRITDEDNSVYNAYMIFSFLVHSFIELVKYLLIIPGVSFLLAINYLKTQLSSFLASKDKGAHQMITPMYHSLSKPPKHLELLTLPVLISRVTVVVAVTKLRRPKSG